MEIGWPDQFVGRRPWRLRMVAASILLGSALLATSACVPSRPLASNGQVARIGAALSLTGPARMFGAAQRSGIRLAQDEINLSHMLGSTHLEVLIEDDGSDRDQASAVFQGFIESHVVAIMGPTLSDTALSVDPVAQQAGVPVLAISNAASGITQIGNSIFRDCLTESQLAPQIIKMVRSRLKDSTMRRCCTATPIRIEPARTHSRRRCRISASTSGSRKSLRPSKPTSRRSSTKLPRAGRMPVHHGARPLGGADPGAGAAARADQCPDHWQ